MSGTTANLNNTPIEFDTTMDSVVIEKVVYDIPGGVTLNVTGVTEDVLKAGRVIVKEASTGVYKPLKISAGSYESLPEGHSYAGILIATILTRKPFASVMLGGKVNDAAVVNYGLPATPDGAKTVLTQIIF